MSETVFKKIKADYMNSRAQFRQSSCADQMHMAERELSAFIRAVTQLYGSEAAKLATEDWLDESELMDSPPLLTERNWRAVTIAASARLTHQLIIAPQQRTLLVSPNQRGASESTIAPSFLLHASGAMPSSRPAASEMRSERERIDDEPRISKTADSV